MGLKAKLRTLLSTLACSAVASAKDFGVKNFDNSKQTGTVGRAASQVKKGMSLAAKVVAGTLGTLTGLEFIREMIGGFTNYKLGSCTIGRVIRNLVKKNEQPDLNGEEYDIELTKEQNVSLNILLAKFKAADGGRGWFDEKIEERLKLSFRKIAKGEFQINENVDSNVGNAIVNSILGGSAEVEKTQGPVSISASKYRVFIVQTGNIQAPLKFIYGGKVAICFK